MQIESIKRWQWCVVGALVGCTVAAVSLWSGPKEPVNSDTIHHAEFERMLINGVNIKGWDVRNIRNVQIHPDVELYNEAPDVKARVHTDYITWEYDAYERHRDGTVTEHPLVGRLIPFQRSGTNVSHFGKDVVKLSARQYAEKLRDHIATLDPNKFKSLTPLKWKQAYIEEPRVAFAVYGGGGVVLIGLIWPTILNLLVGAGLGRDVPEKLMDLSRYGGKPEPSKAKRAVSQHDMDHLAALEAQLEANLREGATERVATAAPVVAEAPVKKLIGGAAATEIAKPDADPGAHKDFGADQGDWYPTEVHGKKK